MNLRKLFCPDFYACYYKVYLADTKEVIESGEFAALGSTYNEAKEDAEKYFMNSLCYDVAVDVKFEVERPNIRQRLS